MASSKGHTCASTTRRMPTSAHNLHRGKIVRPDFIQGIKEHWQSRQLQKNGLAR